MGEDRAVVGPVPLALRDAGEIDLAHCDNGASLLAIDLVSVDVELVIEGVVAADLLKLVIGGRDDRRVEESNIRQRPLARGEDLLRRRIHRPRVVLDFGIHDGVGVAGGIDIALDVGSFLDELAGPDLKLLHDDRVDRAHDDTREDHQAEADDGDRPRLTEHVHDEQRSHNEGNECEDVERGQHRVHIRVLQAGEARHEALTLDREAEPVVPVRDRLEQQEQRNEN